MAIFLQSWLSEYEGWKMYAEVSTYFGDIDLVGERHGVLWGIECKMQLNEKLCYQAVSRKKYLHHVSVAVPTDRANNEIYQEFLEKRGIGILEVHPPYTDEFKQMADTDARRNNLEASRVKEVIAPSLQFANQRERELRVAKIREMKKDLTPWHLETVPGAPSGGQLSPFKLTMLRVHQLLLSDGPMTVKDIVENVRYHYRTASGARRGIANAFDYPEWSRHFIDIEKDGKTMKKAVGENKLSLKDI